MKFQTEIYRGMFSTIIIIRPCKCCVHFVIFTIFVSYQFCNVPLNIEILRTFNVVWAQTPPPRNTLCMTVSKLVENFGRPLTHGFYFRSILWGISIVGLVYTLSYYTHLWYLGVSTRCFCFRYISYHLTV